MERSRLVGTRLGLRVAREALPVFNAFFKRVAEGEREQSCEVAMSGERQEAGYVRMVGVLGQDRQACRLVMTDITERKKAEEERTQAVAVAEAANLAKDHFLAVLSHELRTPLTPVLLMASMLQGRMDLPEDVRDDLQMIARNVEMEARIIDDLLDLTRIARGKLRYDFKPADIHVLLQNAMKICSGGAGARMVMELKAARHRLSADAARLQQVFWNLLSNARKFTPAEGTITVRTWNEEAGRRREIRRGDSEGGEERGECLVIEVSDTGVGIEAELLPRIFEAFEQGESGRARQFGGLGLGLAISKAITEAHGGAISVHSAGRGKGATFRVELPMEK